MHILTRIDDCVNAWQEVTQFKFNNAKYAKIKIDRLLNVNVNIKTNAFDSEQLIGSI